MTLIPSICDRGPASDCPKYFNLSAYVFGKAHLHPDKTALTIYHAPDAAPEVWSYGDLEMRIRQTMTGLQTLGIAPGQRVALNMANDVAFPVFFFALAGMGAVPVPTSSQLTPRELTHVLTDTDAKALVSAKSPRSVGSTQVVHIDPSVLQSFRALPPDDWADTPADALAYIVYTSGTGGQPKGVMHAHRAAFTRQMMWDGWYDLRTDDRVLHAGAFNWTYTLGTGLTDPWAKGASSVIYTGKPDRSVWAPLLRKSGATIFAATPGIYRQILSSQTLPETLRHLRHGLSAGEALPQSTRIKWRAATGTDIHEALGMTEVSTFISGGPAHPAPDGTSGRPQAGRRVAILPTDGGETPVPVGQTGLIAIDRCDPGLMLGYWQRPEETQACFRGMWFVTSDLGAMDADGHVTYHGRTDDVMTVQGYRIAPREIEEVLLTHPDILEAAAAAITVRPGVQTIGAAIVPAHPNITPDALARHCADSLARYKCPRVFVFVAALPRTATGKLKRPALQDLNWSVDP